MSRTKKPRQSAEKIAAAHAKREAVRRKLRESADHAARLEKLLGSRKRFGLLYSTIDAPVLRHALFFARRDASNARSELEFIEPASAWLLCGAKTKAGGPCQRPAVSGKRRCRLHGGLSTGPKTAEGKAKIREANLKRWGSS